MSKYKAHLRKPKGKGTTPLEGRCPICGKRIELRRMSTGLTITKRFCGCMLKPRDFKALAASAGEQGS